VIGFALIIYVGVGAIFSAPWAPLWVTLVAWLVPWVVLGIGSTIDEVDSESAVLLAAAWPITLLVGLGALAGDLVRKVFQTRS